MLPANFYNNAMQVFTPRTPISVLDFFRGRRKEINRVRETIMSPGGHPMIFGKRGIGKTSLANLIQFLIDLNTTSCVQSTCHSSYNFKTIWNRVLQNATVRFRTSVFGFNQSEAEQHINLAAYLPSNNGVSPADVAGVLGMAQVRQAVFVLDEFDRVTDSHTKRQMADLIKIVSDNTPSVTIVLVGVAENIHELIGEHPSVERNLVQIEMQEMSDVELTDVVQSGFTRLGIRAAPEVFNEIVGLSAGFPHYAHVLGLATAKACYTQETDFIDLELFHEMACPLAIDEAIDSYREAFSKATTTTTKSRYPQVLCACALAATDEKGLFRTSDVVDAMSRVFDKTVTNHNIKNALGELSTQERGKVLVQTKRGRVNYYQFREPMMRPFLRIKAKSLPAN